MTLSAHTKGIFLAAISLVAVGEIFRGAPATLSANVNGPAIPSKATIEQKGYALFMLNCAHCHGADARGDEGPDLHGVTKSDARIASLIKDGKKGEMPKFRSKLSDAEVKALVAFVRSLKD
jgi:mono/diheme cytochrome c family protein